MPVGLAVGLTLGLTLGLATGLAAGLVAGLAIEWTTRQAGGKPRALALRCPRPRDLPRILSSGLVDGFAGGSAGWWMIGAVVGLLVGLAGETEVGLSIIRADVLAGLTVGVVRWWGTPVANSPAMTPLGTYQVDRRSDVLVGLLIGLVFGLTFGLTFGPTGAVACGLGSAAAGALVVEPAVSRTGAIFFTELLLRRQGCGQVRFVSLLEDALKRQVLRQAGTVYQFRHAELQDYLAALRTRELT